MYGARTEVPSFNYRQHNDSHFIIVFLLTLSILSSGYLDFILLRNATLPPTYGIDNNWILVFN
jgi:hypothetical protein